ncbi:M56 family metallopeptidase [Butyrivibrio sp. WCD3002]|uniref:M56 family metallopeptidase n=1 Tax=Butyrivibrio sp. WCD3002 TaxID=1280676 RepID=UPI00047A4C5B|nr:M56 family metallopeptidase [Butyrivibrio sp. WCD3002]
METIFMKVMEMSMVAACLIAVVILLRFLLNMAPKWFMGALWSVVALRLMLPFQIQSKIGVLPNFHGIVKVFKYEEFQWIWLAGVLIVLTLMELNYMKIRKKVRASVRMPKLGRNVYKCDDIDTPFVMGFLRPAIYIPSGLDKATIENVLAHERAHIRRADHLRKHIGFLLLAVHWFNPLVWISYALFCRDLELSCDEKVISRMSLDEKKSYATALLRCSTNKRYVYTYQLAFGGVGVSSRVKHIFGYKKATTWLVLILSVLTLGLVSCFFTSSAEKGSDEAEIEISTDKIPRVDFKDSYAEIGEASANNSGEESSKVVVDGVIVESNEVKVQFEEAASAQDPGSSESAEVVASGDQADAPVSVEWSNGKIRIMRGSEEIAFLTKQQIKQYYMAEGYTEAELSDIEKIFARDDVIIDDSSDGLVIEEDGSEMNIRFQLSGKEWRSVTLGYIDLHLSKNDDGSWNDKPEFVLDY